MSVTDGERMRVASEIRHIDAVRLDWTYGDDDVCRTLMLGYIAEAIGLHYAPYEFTSVEIRDRLADLIEPEPHAEEIVAKAYRAAADQIDWELGDTPRVMALRKRAEELEAMARERDADAENLGFTPNSSEATPKRSAPALPRDASATHTDASATIIDTPATCDRAALLALADELEGGFLLFGSTKSARQVFDFLSDKLGEYARRIREACGAAENLQ